MMIGHCSKINLSVKMATPTRTRTPSRIPSRIPSLGAAVHTAFDMILQSPGVRVWPELETTPSPTPLCTQSHSQ